MLDEKPWRPEAVLRLSMSVVLSTIFLGMLGVLAVHCLMAPTKANNVLTLAVIGGAIGCVAAMLFLVGRPWNMNPEQFLINALLLVVCMCAGLLLMIWATRLRGNDHEADFPILEMIVAVLSFQGLALLWMFRFLREHRVSWAEAFGFGRKNIRSLLLGVIVAMAVFTIIRMMQYGIQEVFDHFHVRLQEQLAVQVVRDAQGWRNWLVLGIATMVIAPIAEEMLFRGILYPAIKREGFPRLALWVSSLLFAAIHMNLAAFLPLTFLALVLAWLYEQTGNLLAPIAVHSLFNAFNFALVWAPPSLVEKLPRLFQP
jgi:membrane protease YdiL (CAAX protease family)